MTLLSISQSALDQVGLDRLSQVAGSSLPEARRLQALANRAGNSLMRGHAWRVLISEQTFTTVASTATYSMPSDFDRLLQNTAWDRTNYWQMRGQLSPREWQDRVSSLATSSDLRRAWRITPSSGSKVFTIDPTPASADSLVYEYVSANWCESNTGTGQSAYSADSDVARIPEHLVELQLIWRLLASHGHAYAEQKAEADAEEQRAVGHDLMPAPVVVGAGPRPFAPNIPDGNFTL